MICTVHIGNKYITITTFEQDNVRFSAKISSKIPMSCDQLAVEIKSLCEFNGVNVNNINGSIIASVVPNLTENVKTAVGKLFKGKILTVGPGVKTGLNIKIDFPSELGADFVCFAVCAKEKYQLPLLMVDMGTAVKISALNENGCFLGCSIMPGMDMSAEALSTNTAQLPHISFEKAEGLIGKNTVESMKSGIIYGMASMIDGMIEKYKKEMKAQRVNVIITGENSEDILKYLEHDLIYDKNIIAEGMNIIYKKNF